MAVDRLLVMLVVGAVVATSGRPDERRVDVVDRVVLVAVRGSDCGARRELRDLAFELRMDRSGRILELADRAARDVLDDRLQAPARPTTGGPFDRRLAAHGRTRPSTGL